MAPNLSSRTIALKIFSTLCVAANVACVKIAAGHFPIGEVVAFRGFFALPVLIAYGSYSTGIYSVVHVARAWPHVWRAILGCSGMGCYFWSISLLPLPIAVAISFMTPVVVALTAFYRMQRRQAVMLVVAGLLGLFGVYVLSVDDSRGWDVDRFIGCAIGVIGAVMTAGAIIKVRELTKTDSASAIAFYFSLACFVFGMMTMPFGWRYPSANVFGVLVLSGLFSGLGHVAMTEALARADPAALSPFDFLVIGWAVMADVIVFGRQLVGVEWYGLVLIVSAAVLAGVARSKN